MIHDYGIDAHVEIADPGSYPTGKLIAIQVKSGVSYFNDESEHHFAFTPEEKHVNYWIGHSIPVILFLYNPETEKGYWRFVSKDTVVSTGKGWKILVPKVSALEEQGSFLRDLSELTQPESYIRRLNRLRIDRRWMNLIQQGHEVAVQFDNWVNKSLPRFQIKILVDQQEKESYPTVYVPGLGIESMLNHFFPWASLRLDEQAFRENAYNLWEDECYQFSNDETGEKYYSQSFEDWYDPPKEHIVPVSENGETSTYSLLLSLNDIGRNFLLIDDYLAEQQEISGFTLEDRWIKKL